ncbi:peptidylprolyl isomerase [Nitratireductor aestuarii]|uniref:Parvulin-like PPIase n=1 Tax=Nitratireductor aestuarii TaxID=1735103 RepID=A0A916RFT2_9HYPH|nr:SurA N-terminal domain-containing protein [Nitratireductor aestuarii]GGA54446.1 peptidylprolyl isomerase [Nitratireductor aestuarii]
MLDSLRKAANTWVAKLLLGILVLSFGIWGISGQMLTDPSALSVVTAGKTEVSVMDYRLAFDRRVAELSRQFGTQLTRAQAEAFGVQEQVLSEVTVGALLDETSRKMGLGVSRESIAELAAKDPTFQGFDGRFDVARFDYILQQIGMTRDAYLRNQTQVARRQQIVDAVATGVDAPATLLQSIAQYRGEDRTVDYVVLPRSLVEPIEEPKAEDLQAYFDANKTAYAAPEFRTISYVKLEPEDIAEPEAVAQEDIERAYEQGRANYTVAERRTIEQINFDSEEAAQAAQESLRSGVTFEDLVQLQGKKLEDVNLGHLPRTQLADEKIAEAAFSLPENQVSEVVEGTFGPVILRVTKIEPEKVTPLAEVEKEIRQQLAVADATRQIQDAYDAYEDARAGGATLKEAADSLGLTVQTIQAVSAKGEDQEGKQVTLPNSTQLLSAAFETDEGVENAPLNFGSSGYLFYEVEEIIPARERTLDEVRDRVVADWTRAEVSKRLKAKAEEFAKAVRDGTRTLDQVAEEISQEKTTKRGLKRESNDPDLGRGGVGAVFAVQKGGVGSFPNPAGDGEFLFQVTEVFQPAAATSDAVPADVAKSIGDTLTQDLLIQLAARLQSDLEVTVNRNAMQQALTLF